MEKQFKTANLAAKQANNLLFASLFLDMDEVVQAAQALLCHPEKGNQIKEALQKMMIEELPRLKTSMSHDELKNAVADRVAMWTKIIGNPTIEQCASLSKYWNVPIGDIIKDKITPTLIYDLLNCFIVGQEDYKRQLSTSFYLNMLKNDERSGLLELPQSNLLVCGPSGSGKTFGIQTLARYFGLPVIIIHCNTLVQEGIRGINIPDYFTHAYRSFKTMDKDLKKAELRKAIVCFDEFDKLYEKGHYNETIRNEILGYIDDNGEICFSERPDNEGEKITLSTKQMMFVFTGVFQGLDKICSGERLGFYTNAQNDSNPKRISSSDLIKFGIKPEIVGRIQNYTTVDKLSTDNLYEVLDSKLDSPLNSFQNYFQLNGIEMTVTDDAKMLLAEMAYEKGLGVRGIKSLLNAILCDEMHSLKAGKHFEIDSCYIKKHIN